MEFLVTFTAELIVLFFLSRIVTSYLSLAFYRITKNRNATIYLIAFLFFPGTVIHELSHALVASLLFVPIGDIEFIPKIEGEKVKLGSVAIARPDLFRRFFIGIAPFVVGIAVLLITLSLLIANHLLSLSHPLFLLLGGYVAFEIGNTMFSSEKDMEGAIELLVAITAIGVLLAIIGLRTSMIHWQAFLANPHLVDIFMRGSILLLIPLGIDILFVVLFKLFFKRY